MPKPEDLQVIMERRPNWEFLRKLPRELFGFVFEEGGALNGHEFLLCAYNNEKARRRLELVYILGWKCVCGKGEFHVGDLVVYFEKCGGAFS